MPSRVFAVPVLEKWLLHAPLHQITGVVNEAVIEELRSGQAADPDGELAGLWEELSSDPPEEPKPLTGDIAPDFLGIIPTRGCNIGCVYCNFGGPTAEMIHMDPAIAVASIDWMADKLVEDNRETFRIHFFGGEPFVSGEIIDIVVHRARYVAAQRGLRASFDASTNGIFSESRAQFIGDYFDSVLLSFDGFEQFHDRNRPAYNNKPTFEVVSRTAKRLSVLPVNLCLRVCITHESVTEMANMTRWMLEEFQPAVINFETLTPGDLGKKAGLFPPDPYEFTRQCMESFRIAKEMGIRAVYSAAELDQNRISFCPVGTDTPIVGIDGKASACYLLEEDWQNRGLDMTFAQVGKSGVQINADALDKIRQLPMQKPRCEGCFCQWSCAGGCHINHSYPGCQEDYDDFCLQTRLITACLLLNEIGCQDMAEELLGDPAAMKEFAQRPWDTLTIGGPAYVESH